MHTHAHTHTHTHTHMYTDEEMLVLISVKVIKSIASVNFKDVYIYTGSRTHNTKTIYDTL